MGKFAVGLLLNVFCQLALSCSIKFSSLGVWLHGSIIIGKKLNCFITMLQDVETLRNCFSQFGMEALTDLNLILALNSPRLNLKAKLELVCSWNR